MPNLAERFRTILNEQSLKQVEFARALGVSSNYVNLLVNGRKGNISETLAKLIEETYGYSTDWVMSGYGEKLSAQSVSYNKLETIKKIRKMSEEEINAVLAFIHTLENVRKSSKLAAGGSNFLL